MSEAPDMFIIEKSGIYYRPDAAGYTYFKRDAGRYTFDEAVVRVGPNGPEGPQDGLSMWAESEAPIVSTACPVIDKRLHTRDLRIAELEAEVKRLRGELQECDALVLQLETEREVVS